MKNQRLVILILVIAVLAAAVYAFTMRDEADLPSTAETTDVAVPASNPVAEHATPQVAIPVPLSAENPTLKTQADQPSSTSGLMPANAMEIATACKKQMTDYATAHHTDPSAYVAKNVPYLQQCIQAKLPPAEAK